MSHGTLEAPEVFWGVPGDLEGSQGMWGCLMGAWGLMGALQGHGALTGFPSG